MSDKKDISIIHQVINDISELKASDDLKCGTLLAAIAPLAVSAAIFIPTALITHELASNGMMSPATLEMTQTFLSTGLGVTVGTGAALAVAGCAAIASEGLMSTIASSIESAIDWGDDIKNHKEENNEMDNDSNEAALSI